MILRDDMPFSMDVLKRGLMALRERTESSFYVHDLRRQEKGNSVLQLHGVLATSNRVAHITARRSIEMKDGDIVTFLNAEGKMVNFFVFDVVKNRFSQDKFTMHAMLWTLPVRGFGLCGKSRFDDFYGRRSVAIGYDDREKEDA